MALKLSYSINRCGTNRWYGDILAKVQRQFQQSLLEYHVISWLDLTCEIIECNYVIDNLDTDRSKLQLAFSHVLSNRVYTPRIVMLSVQDMRSNLIKSMADGKVLRTSLMMLSNITVHPFTFDGSCVSIYYAGVQISAVVRKALEMEAVEYSIVKNYDTQRVFALLRFKKSICALNPEIFNICESGNDYKARYAPITSKSHYNNVIVSHSNIGMRVSNRGEGRLYTVITCKMDNIDVYHSQFSKVMTEVYGRSFTAVLRISPINGDHKGKCVLNLVV